MEINFPETIHRILKYQDLAVEGKIDITVAKYGKIISPEITIARKAKLGAGTYC